MIMLVPDRYPESTLEFKFLSGGRPTHSDVGTGQGEAKELVEVIPSGADFVGEQDRKTKRLSVLE